MTRKNRVFVSASGTAYDVLQKLAQAVYGMGGDDDDLRKIIFNKGLRYKLADLIVGAKNDRMLVDLDAGPFVPDGWSVDVHRKGGQIEFDPAKIVLYLSMQQKGDVRIEGHKLREELKAQPVYNANLLDWLLRKKNQHLISKNWKGKTTFFWGTIYRCPGGNLCVRCLHWDGGKWYWSYLLLDDDWLSDDSAVVSAS